MGRCFTDIYLGLDGGGTRTTAVAADKNGKILMRVTGETINFNSVGMELARKNFHDIVAKIKQKLGTERFKSVFVGSSALFSKADEKTLYEFCGGIIEAEYIGMNSDVYIALASIDTTAPRAIVIAGTGSIAAGIDKNGKLHVKGGWGHILGDEGSAYSIALWGLKCAVNEFDSGASVENAPLIKHALDFFGVSSMPEVINKIYNPIIPKDKLAKFAPLVFSAAKDGDMFANETVNRECERLAATLIELIKEMGECEYTALYGGVFQNNMSFTESFINLLHSEYPNIKAELLKTPPEEGALKEAFKLAGM